MTDYQVIIIGAGPAGYVAAIRCAQLGMKTACIDKWVHPESGQLVLGGTCLNVGCIPSKALLDSSHHYYFLRHQAQAHGIHCPDLTIDMATVQTRKAEVVKTLTQGIATLFKKNKVTALAGQACFISPNELEIVNSQGSSQRLSADHFIIATGAVPVEIPAAPFDHQFIVDSTGALAFDRVPPRLGIIGAGAIGLELGSVWSRLGSQVTILEALPEFLATADRKIATAALRELKKQGLDIKLGAQVTAATVNNAIVTVTYQDTQGVQSLEVDKLIVAVGRKPYLQGLNAQEIGIKINQKGFIEVNEHRQTAIAAIYAIGDVIGGPMLAHKGAEEGMMVAERLAGQKSEMHYDTVPWVIYTSPEIAWVGKTEEQLKAAGVEYTVGQFPMMACGRARAQGETAGMVRMIADAKTDKLLGVHILSASASELIAEAVTALEFEASSEDLARTIHAHPTLAEALHEAALAVAGRAIHV